MDGLFSGQQVAVRDRLLALHRGSQHGASLLENICTHVLHDGTHNDHADEKSKGRMRLLETRDKTSNHRNEYVFISKCTVHYKTVGCSLHNVESQVAESSSGVSLFRPFPTS